MVKLQSVMPKWKICGLRLPIFSYTVYLMIDKLFVKWIWNNNFNKLLLYNSIKLTLIKSNNFIQFISIKVLHILRHQIWYAKGNAKEKIYLCYRNILWNGYIRCLVFMIEILIIGRSRQNNFILLEKIAKLDQ